ncbi:MAG: pentapeptide repeat-containing protein [Planctomycetota bacterium]|nr:pentapeptide repeat-containing protein [Planctomycetota bacterium]
MASLPSEQTSPPAAADPGPLPERIAAELADLGRSASTDGAVDLEGADLSGVDVSGLDLSLADLRGARLAGADLSGASLARVRAEGADLTGANLAGADLTDAQLGDACLGGADLSNVRLRGARLEGAILSGATLEGADLTAASLDGARLVGATLDGATFDGARLVGADLSDSTVEGASFARADLSSATLSLIRGYRAARWSRTRVEGADPHGALLLIAHIGEENFIEEFRAQSRRHEVVYHIWRFTSDCGRSVGRLAACCAVLAAVFALIYTRVGIDFGPNETWLSPVYLSLVTLTTLGFGDAVPTSVAGQIAVMTEVVLGYVMLGGILTLIFHGLSKGQR